MSCCNGNSILNRTSSLIGAPICVPNCPPSGYGCPDIIQSDCVVFTGVSAPIVNVYQGDTFTTVIQNINNLITQIVNATIPCKVWNTIGASGTIGNGNFQDGWSNSSFGLSAIQGGEYSDIFECSVYLRGFIEGPWVGGTGQLIFVLPVGFRPSITHVFSTTLIVENTISSNYDGNTFAAFIVILSNGQVIVNWNARCCATQIQNQDDNPTIMKLTLDGISFTV